MPEGGKGQILLLQPVTRYTCTSPLYPTEVITVLFSNVFTYNIYIIDTMFFEFKRWKELKRTGPSVCRTGVSPVCYVGREKIAV